MSTTHTTVTLPAYVERRVENIQELITKANREKPDPAALAQLRAVFDEVPQVWQLISDVTGHVQRDLITTMVAGAGSRDALTRRTRAMRDDLGYKEAPELERGLIDHIVTCWLRLSKLEHSYTQMMATSLSLAQGDYWERRLTHAQTRYRRACETLARVRRLSRPGAVQVNIGDKQVNIAGDTPARTLGAAQV